MRTFCYGLVWVDFSSSFAHSPIPQANFELRLGIVIAVINEAAAIPLPFPFPLPFPLTFPFPFPLVLLHGGQLFVEELLLRLEEIMVILQSGQLWKLLLVCGRLLLRWRCGSGSLVRMMVMMIVVGLMVVQLLLLLMERRMALQLVMVTVVMLQTVAAL